MDYNKEDFEKQYLNKDLYGLNEDDFNKSFHNDIISDDFTDQLEWAMLMLDSNFKQIRSGGGLTDVKRHHFDKAFLLTASLKDGLGFFAPHSDLQVTPDIFPNISIKIMTISDTVQLFKVRELSFKEKIKNRAAKYKYAFDVSCAHYKMDNESFFCDRIGYGAYPELFNFSELRSLIKEKNKNEILRYFPHPFSLKSGYYVPDNAILTLTPELIIDAIDKIAVSYQIALTYYYEWCLYLRDNNGMGITIPIDPDILPEIYNTSLLKIDSRKKLIHFVRDYYRRRRALPGFDYDIYVKKYLRGEYKFDYKGFYCEVIPPQYDLNRSSTRKKFINPIKDGN